MKSGSARNVVFARPIVVSDEGLGIHIALTAQEDGAIDFEILGGEESLVHSQRRLSSARRRAFFQLLERP
jgi:hypothetical protein